MKSHYFLICSYFVSASMLKNEISSSELRIPKSPIIGVVSQELTNKLEKMYPVHSCYIQATYVRALESSGARVVPIVINKDESYYRQLMTSINGVVLPGGHAKIGRGNPYYDTVRLIYKISKEINDEGIKFPILAVCLGFEFLITVANDDESILMRCETFYENLPLHFMESPSETQLFSQLNDVQAHALQHSNCTFNWHIWCALIEDFKKTKLHDWRITSTSFNSKGLEFIASVEHKSYPFFGIQFHPEKVPHDWRVTELHTKGGTEANRYFYDILVDFARQNYQEFQDEETEKRWLIFNYSPVYWTEDKEEFNHIYIF